MRRGYELALGIVLLGLTAGCRTATQVKEFPRVDLQVQGTGNRGYLVGTPPPTAERKTTRQMVELNVEVPDYFPGGTAEEPSQEQAAVAQAETGKQAPPKVWQPPEHFDTYVVQKGDSLWSIAAKPEVYGKATQWRRIFDANRDLLHSPGGVKAGMTLRIPREGAGAEEAIPSGPTK